MTRSRIDVLERRYQRVAIEGMLAIGLTLIAALIGIAAVRSVQTDLGDAQDRLADTQREQDRARYRAVFSACLERNAQRRGNLLFLEHLPASPRVLAEAQRWFRLEPDCRRYTLRLLGEPAPPGAFKLPRAARPRPAG